MAQPQLVRVLGLKESISMTIGTVVGVGLFTCGSSQIGVVGPWIFVMTVIGLLISIWPCLLYGEMGAAMPCAGGTYSFARRGVGRIVANVAGWNYIISVVAIGSGEALAFGNYFSILLEQLGFSVDWLKPEIVASVLILIFLIINYLGIKQSGKAQIIFMFFFWACAISWFLYMIPSVHVEYFNGVKMDSLPPFKELMYILGLVWWCYTGFETSVTMGGETKYPQYTIPRALKISIFLIFACNALFQWFLVALVPHEFYGILAVADAPYAEGLKAAGLIGFPLILLCLGIAFGGDFSTINPGIAAPARYIYSMADDNALPKFFARIHPKFKVPHYATLLVGVLNIALILTGSIVFIASVSLVSLAICYIIGCISYIGLKVRWPQLDRPYKAPLGVPGAIVSIIAISFVIAFADSSALLTSLCVSLVSVLYWLIFSRKKTKPLPSLEEEIGTFKEPKEKKMKKLNRQYNIWRIAALVATLAAVAAYIVPLVSPQG